MFIIARILNHYPILITMSAVRQPLEFNQRPKSKMTATQGSPCENDNVVNQLFDQSS